METSIALLIGLTLGLISGMIAMAHRAPRCSCRRLLPSSCPPGYGCRTDVRTWPGYGMRERR